MENPVDRNSILLMCESLEKKIVVLNQIREMNGKQKEILKNPRSSPDELEENLSRKGGLIVELERLDSGFSTLYEKVREELRINKDKYADEIAEMKELIRKITALSAAVEREEKENKELAAERFSDVRKMARRIRKNEKAVSSYYKTMSQSTDPGFMDQKN